jgi:hypothetical protein
MYIRNKAHSFPSCFRSLPLCFTPSNWLRNRSFVSPYSGFSSGLFISTGPVLFTGSGEFKGLFTGGFRGLCLRLVIQTASVSGYSASKCGAGLVRMWLDCKCGSRGNS